MLFLQPGDKVKYFFYIFPLQKAKKTKNQGSSNSLRKCSSNCLAIRSKFAGEILSYAQERRRQEDERRTVFHCWVRLRSRQQGHTHIHMLSDTYLHIHYPTHTEKTQLDERSKVRGFYRQTGRVECRSCKFCSKINLKCWGLKA